LVKTAIVIWSAALAKPANWTIEPASTAAVSFRIVTSIGIPSLRGAKRRSNPSSLLPWLWIASLRSQ